MYMVSNALSARRGPLRRPKVCHESRGVRGPGVTHPPGTMVCSITPEEAEISVSEDLNLMLAACDGGSAVSSRVNVLTNGDGGSFDALFELENCNEVPAVFVSANPGVYNITAEFTSLANRLCIASATVIVNV